MTVTTSLRQNKKSYKLSGPKKGFEKEIEIEEEIGDHTPEKFTWWAKTHEGNFSHHKGDSIDYYAPDGAYLSSDNNDWWGIFSDNGILPPSKIRAAAALRKHKIGFKNRYFLPIKKAFLYLQKNAPKTKNCICNCVAEEYPIGYGLTVSMNAIHGVAWWTQSIKEHPSKMFLYNRSMSDYKEVISHIKNMARYS